jgi:aspartate beta-hydroxylase
MIASGGGVQQAVAEASRLWQSGNGSAAAALLRSATAREPGVAPAWNLLGVIELDLGDAQAAVQSFNRGIAIEAAPPLWLNLARAQRTLGLRSDELGSLDQALTRDPLYLPAILAKGEVLIALDREPEAVELYRLVLQGLTSEAEIPPAIAAQLDAARAFLARHGDRQMQSFETALAEVATKSPGQNLDRVRAYAEQRAGKRQVYQQRPIGSHFPYLPAIEFFDRDLFPWLPELEQQTAAMQEEILALWAENPEQGFRPYVVHPPGVPLGQWAELNHSPRWSAWFFWENGVRHDANCARCPKTTAVLDTLPLLDIPSKGPTAMISILEPHTRIPPHTGTSNTRTTIHLPLVVPPGCGFRVGAETREWREGEAWAFDDTIEHEAWNDSDRPRAILIIDSWNPLLTEAEREVVRRIG